MSISEYKKWMTEAFIDERASTDKYNTKSFEREDGETWDTAKGRAGKYKGQIRYFNADTADDDADLYAKTGKVQNAVGGDDDKKDDKPKGKQVDIDATGGFDSEKPADEPSDMDTERPDDEPEDYEPSADDYDAIYGTRNQTGGGFQKSRDEKPNYDDDNYAKKTDDIQADVAKKYGLSAMQVYDNAGKEPEDFDSWDEYESHLNDVAKDLKDKGYSDPYGDDEEDPIGAAGDVPVGELPDRSDDDETGDKEEIEAAREELAQAQEYLEFSQEELKMAQDPDEIERAKKIVAQDKKEVERAKKELARLYKRDREKSESIKVINGKKYKAIKESVNKKVTVKEVKSWLKGLEEFRYRKIPGVDVRRITSFVNNGLSETDLPKSLQKKWENAKYSKEKGLADRFMKERINKKLTQNESKHPLKEQYDRLFKNRVVL